ncbi:hypothetical protein GGQ59_002929, partial [Parvularcula dongshanensis]
CATGASQTPLTDGWSIVRDLGVGEPRSGQRGLVAPPDAEVVYLRHTGEDSWEASLTGNLADPNQEAVWLRASDKSVGLAAAGEVRDRIRGRNDACIVKEKAPRRVAGYTGCNSVLTAPRGVLGKTAAAAAGFTPEGAAADPISYAAHPPWMREALAGLDLDRLYADAAARRESFAAGQTDRLRAAAAAYDAAAAEDERQAELEREEAARREAEYQASLAPWRASLAPGDRTVCGLVVRVDPPIVQIQYAEAPRWVRIDQIVPAGTFEPASVDRVVYCARL